MKDNTILLKNEAVKGIMSSITLRRVLVLLVTTGLCGLVIWETLFSGEKVSNIKQERVESGLRPVSVIHVEKQSYQTAIEAFGEVTPEWKVTLKSKVKGEILQVSDAFRKGNTVRKGDLLIGVEQADYKVQLSEALQGVKEASTKLLVEQKEGLDAGAAWKRSGLQGVPDSPLLLRKPYLEIAEARLVAAKERVRQAQLLMDYTHIKAPFDGLVVDRKISLGGTLFVGDEIGTLYGMDTFVVALHISDKEWGKLSDNWREEEVQLIAEGAGDRWSGTLVREGKIFEHESRLRTLYIEIDEPLQQSPPLLPGTFVKAEIPGRVISQLLRVPDSARTQKGLVWYVDKDNRLQSVEAIPVFREKGYLYFEYQGEDAVAVVINPNNSFVNGLRVTPLVKEN